MPSFVKSVTFDCREPLVVAAFWAEALGSNVDEDSTPDRAWVEPAGWGGPSLWFQKVPEAKTAKNRQHFDLRVVGPLAGERVRAGTVEVFTTKLAPGKRKVVRKGEPGVRKVVKLKTLHNGEQVRSRVVKRTLVRDPRPRRVLVGRKPYSVPGTEGLNWGALANCESGGNPNAVNPAGYYGLYQFDTGTWRSVGGSGLPTSASAAEQTYRAKLLYKARGRSPWPTCGRLL